MIITCPKCNFSKAVDPAKLPDRPIKVNCPKCATAFTFNKSNKVTDSNNSTLNGKRISEKKNDIFNSKIHESRQKTIKHSPQELPKAGFWIRVVAWVLDTIIVLIIQAGLELLLNFSLGMVNISDVENSGLSTVFWLFALTIRFGYAVFFVGYCGQTLGKMAVRIKVVRTEGSQLTYGRAAVREVLGKIISALLLGIGYLMVAFDHQKQGLHDKIADTYVIKL
jgi:predicted Zn finger-like uncharacterized protein